MTVTYGFVDPGQQAWMLLDRVRVDAYARAIAEIVRPGDVVLDIGSGSGILALLAAKAGARRVYAVERTGMIELVRSHARENGFADVIVPVRRDFLDVTFDGEAADKPRVVIGEVLGHFAADEAQHHLYARARQIVRDDAVFIPSHYRLRMAAAAPIKLREELEALRGLHGLSLSSLAEKLLHRVSLFQLIGGDLMGPEVECERNASDAPLPKVFRARIPVEHAGQVLGVSVAFDATLSASVELSTRATAPATCWGQVFFPIHPPIDALSGDVLDVEIRPRIVTDRGTYAWTVKKGDIVRKGDAMKSLVGDLEDTAAQLGLRVKDDDERFTVSRRLRAWATALGGSIAEDLDAGAMAQRIVDDDGASYPDLSAALQEVRSLLLAAGAMRARA